ncbi:hypothetical protein GCM10029992_48590 [Glycomyces albus]
MPRIPLPPTDGLGSPYTGWTRAHWESVADHLLEAVVPFATPDFAQIRLPGRTGRAGLESDGLEGFARTFLLAACRIGGIKRAGDAATGEVEDRLLERYARGLAAGTDPGHRHAWPQISDCSQQLVEAASIAVALHETRPWLFDRLDPAVRERVVHWLAGVIGKRTRNSNWALFPVVIEQFLASIGGPHAPEEIEGGLDRIEQWYVGDGWYTDGDGQSFDYYAGWAMHLYPLLWARMSGDEDRGALYRERLRLFLSGYQHFFAADGAPIHQGRSLCYRFASVAPLWLGELSGTGPLPPGRTRRLASGALRHFVEHGVPDSRGLLSLGWYDRFLPCTQAYSGPASPTGRARRSSASSCRPTTPRGPPGRRSPGRRGRPGRRAARAGLDPASHPTRRRGAPAQPRQRPGPTPEPRRDGRPALLADRLLHAHRPRDRRGGAAARGRRPRGRVRPRRHGLTPTLYPAHRPVRPVRRLRLRGRAALRSGPRRDRLGRPRPLGGARQPRHRPRRDHGQDGGHSLAHESRPASRSGDAWSMVTLPDGLGSAMVALHGYRAAGVARAASANAFGPCSAAPCLSAPDHPGGTTIHVSLAVLTGDRLDPAALAESVRAEVDGDQVTLHFPDGERVEVALGERPAYARHPADSTETVRWPA